jgi:hypothetical protein
MPELRTHWTPRHLLLAVSSAACACSGGAMASVSHYEGTAFDARGRALYSESHWLREEAGARSRLVLYRCPDGTPFARKRVSESLALQAPDFALEDGRSAYREGVRHVDGAHREVFVRPRDGGAERRAALAAGPDTVIDAGFDAFIRAHWDALAPHEEIGLDFLVPSRLGTIGFVARRLADDALDGRPVRRFRLELGAWYAFATPAIDVAYDADTRRLREYRGIANIRDDHGRNLTVRIDFPRAAADSDARAFDTALGAPLDGRCTL